MASSIDCNIVIIHLKEAKKDCRIDICRGYFEIIQNGAIIIDKLFETIYYFPKSFSKQEVQAHMKNNTWRMFPSFNKGLCSLNQLKRNVVLVKKKTTYVTDKTDSLAQIFQDLPHKYGQIFHFEYDAVKNCLKQKTKSKNGVKDVISLEHTEKCQSTADWRNAKGENQNTNTSTRKRTIVMHQRMKEELNNKKYCPNLQITFALSSYPIFRTYDTNPALPTAVVNSNIDPDSLCEAHSSLGEIVSDGPELSPIAAPSTSLPQPSHQTHTSDHAAHNATVSNNNPTQIGQLEEASSSVLIPPSVHSVQEENGNRWRLPKHPRYSTYDARIASYATFREFCNIDTKMLAKTGLFYTGKAHEVQCFQCGIEHRNFTPEKDPLLEHIKESPACLFIETFLGVNTLNQYKAQIRLSGSLQLHTLGTTDSTSVPVFTAHDHIRSPHYQDYKMRLSTFARWPPSITQKPEQVTQAGFYYTGLSDVVKCFACDGGLKNWDPEDEPWIEHARWFPQCPFVQKVKGLEFVHLVRRMTEESDEEDDVVHPPYWHSPYLEEPKLVTDLDEPRQLDTDAAQIVIKTGYSKEAIAMAIDDLINKGNRKYAAQDIMEVILEKEDRGEPLPTDSNSELTRIPSQSLRSIPSANEDREKLLRENESLKSIVTCIKCKVKQRNILFLPCTHYCLCQVCAEKCSLCPVCYKIIKHKIETHMV